jgi:hypothetical protein
MIVLDGDNVDFRILRMDMDCEWPCGPYIDCDFDYDFDCDF